MKKYFCGLIIILLCQSVVSADIKDAGRKIEINIPSNTLSLYSGNDLIKTYPICVGKTSTPSKLGNFHVIYKTIDPYWYSKGKVTSPGPDNPLGVRWIGMSRDIGIHGNNKPESIGTFASGGCIRMYNNDVTELYNLVPVNTPIAIKYERIMVVVDKYSGKQVTLIYPDKYKINQDNINDIGRIKDSLDSKVKEALKQKLNIATAISEGLGIFLNDQFITSDAYEKNNSIYINSLAASEVFGISPEFINRYNIAIEEKDNKVYFKLNDIIVHQKGKLQYNKKSGNAYVQLSLLKVNGVFLSNQCGDFDKQYLMEANAIKNLKSNVKEDTYGISFENKDLKKILHSGRTYVDLSELAKDNYCSVFINSSLKMIDIKMPAIIKYRDQSYKTVLIENRLVLNKKDAIKLFEETKTETKDVQVWACDTQYVDLEELLQKYVYKTNEFCTIIELEEKENQ